MALENYGTIWVCINCLHHHANGECGDCHSDHGHDEEPLNAIEWPFSVAMGGGWEEHNDACIVFVINDLKRRFPDRNWPEVPGDYECDCEFDSFSRSPCDGCNSWLHGERHAMTLFKNSEV
jgi:hypothetical protein